MFYSFFFYGLLEWGIFFTVVELHLGGGVHQLISYVAFSTCSRKLWISTVCQFWGFQGSLIIYDLYKYMQNSITSLNISRILSSTLGSRAVVPRGFGWGGPARGGCPVCCKYHHKNWHMILRVGLHNFAPFLILTQSRNHTFGGRILGYIHFWYDVCVSCLSFYNISMLRTCDMLMATRGEAGLQRNVPSVGLQRRQHPKFHIKITHV